MTPIPPDVREAMARDPFMKRCCLASDGMCAGRIEWHHAVIFAGRQVQKRFAIIGACKDYHHRFANRKDIAERFLKVVLSRGTEQELFEISKAIDYVALKKKYMV